VLGTATALIGFDIQHDGGHRTFSRHAWANRLAAMSLDLIGGSSYVWHWQHAVFHHTYPNLTGHDADIELGPLARLTPHQKRYPFHRWQHVYLWPFYGLMAISWQMMGDYREIVTGTIGGNHFPRPKGWDLVTFFAGKALFLGLAFGVPLMFHSVWSVLLFYAVASSVLGLVLSVVFQLAHCVEEAEFPLPREDTGRVGNAWAVHQVETTVDFARRSRVACWLLGGLNFQVEHHLFPRICHIHYPALSKVVEATCREHGVKYLEHTTVCAGVAAHFRWLRKMGMPLSAG
jgi:linoleoyl-CoA desaturase